MSRISIASASGSYNIHLSQGDLVFSSQYAAIILDENVSLPESFSAIPTLKLQAVESRKTLSSVEEVCSFMLSVGCNRSSKVLAVGGGFIQDIATISSSLFMRGIRWDYAPTTLIGMADSCIGGKSSINIAAGKNVIGNFYPPEEILVNSSFIASLSSDTLLAGIFESVKILFAKEPSSMNSIMLEPAVSGTATDSEWLALIVKTLRAKKWFVEVDEFDVKERQLLNFGHSFGHALEAATNYKVQHGIAIGFGMLAALEFSENSIVGPGQLLHDFCISSLRKTTSAMTLTEQTVDWQVFERAISTDKKNTSEEVVLILPNKDWELEKVYVPKTAESFAKIQNAMKTAIRKASTDEVF